MKFFRKIIFEIPFVVGSLLVMEDKVTDVRVRTAEDTIYLVVDVIEGGEVKAKGVDGDSTDNVAEVCLLYCDGEGNANKVLSLKEESSHLKIEEQEEKLKIVVVTEIRD